jgi:hypothetical protein
VSEWIDNPSENERPQLSVLDQAEVHAKSMGDQFMLDQIEKVRREWIAIEGTPTPKRPPPPESVQKIFKKPSISEIGPKSYKDYSIGRQTEDLYKQASAAPGLDASGDNDMDLLRKYIRDLK